MSYYLDYYSSPYLSFRVSLHGPPGIPMRPRAWGGQPQKPSHLQHQWSGPPAHTKVPARAIPGFLGSPVSARTPPRRGPSLSRGPWNKCWRPRSWAGSVYAAKCPLTGAERNGPFGTMFTGSMKPPVHRRTVTFYNRISSAPLHQQDHK